MIYGYDRTFHRGVGHVDIETDAFGKVVAVWYRCITLPFEQHRVGEDRARMSRKAYEELPPRPVLAMDIDDGAASERGHFFSNGEVGLFLEDIRRCHEALAALETKLTLGQSI